LGKFSYNPEQIRIGINRPHPVHALPYLLIDPRALKGNELGKMWICNAGSTSIANTWTLLRSLITHGVSRDRTIAEHLVHAADQVVNLVLPVSALATLHVVHALLVHATHCKARGGT